MTLPHSLKRFDYFECLRREASERRQYLASLEACSLAEHYVKSDLSVVLELGVQRNNLAERVQSMRYADVQSVDSSVWILEFHALDSGDREHRDQKMMFVVDVKEMEGQNVGVPSLVTLHHIDSKSNEGGRYVGFDGRFMLIPGLLRVNRKFAMTGGVDGAPCNIESAVKVVNYVTNNKGDIGAQFLVSKEVVEEMFPRVQVHVQAGAVTVGRGAESVLEIRDVLIGPCDL